MKLRFAYAMMTATLVCAMASRATADVPAPLVGEWKASFDILALHSDGSFLRSTHRADLFSYCGPSLTVSSIGVFATTADQITITPKDGFFGRQNSCNKYHERSRYVNVAHTYVYQLDDNGRTLVLTGPIGTKYSIRNVFHRTSDN